MEALLSNTSSIPPLSVPTLDSDDVSGTLFASPAVRTVIVAFIIAWLANVLPNSRLFKDTSRPAVVPYFIPWLGSAIAMGLDPDGFVARNVQRFGPAFFVDVIGTRFLYLTKAEPVKWALKQPKNISIKGVEYEALQDIFGLSEEAARMETSTGTAFKILSRDTAKWSVRPTVMNFQRQFRSTMDKFVAGWTPQEVAEGKVIGLSDHLLPLIYGVFSKSALGDDYPGEPFWHDHNEFHDAFPVLFSGMPKKWAKGGIKSRQNLSAQVYRLLQAHMQSDDPSEDSAPLFMKIVAKVLGQQSDMNMDDAAKMVNLYMFAGDNVGLGSFWIICRALSHTGLYKRLRDEADAGFTEYLAEKPTTVVKNADGTDEERPTRFGDMLVDLPYLDKLFPLLNSVFKEMLRYHGKQMFNRRAETDLEITPDRDEPTKKLLIRKGDRIILWMRPTHHDPAVFKDPHTFKPERFMATAERGSGDIDESNNGFMLPFGFGTTVCPGRFLASFEIRNVVLCMLRTFDMEYVGVSGMLSFLAEKGDGMEKRIPKQNLATFGTPLSMPFGDLNVRLKLRKDGGL